MKYKRILLKLSGEALLGKNSYGIDNQRLLNYAKEIKELNLQATLFYLKTPQNIVKITK